MLGPRAAAWSGKAARWVHVQDMRGAWGCPVWFVYAASITMDGAVCLYRSALMGHRRRVLERKFQVALHERAGGCARVDHGFGGKNIFAINA
ncbi:hypothetical protein [Acetobacter pasteurianus]|uniref:hypothetical protein n=1 Tax=Acetobacter pasteurianus TaxID=438 RepID=UPI000F556263|nr:hypothetical protein [Acetobacter pasteurianus]